MIQFVTGHKTVRQPTIDDEFDQLIRDAVPYSTTCPARARIVEALRFIDELAPILEQLCVIAERSTGVLERVVARLEKLEAVDKSDVEAVL